MNSAKNFPIVLIAPFNIDLGVRHISAFLKSKGYPAYVILFNQMRYVAEFYNNDYISGPLLKHQICPEKDLSLLIDLLRKLKPKLIGISVTSTVMRTAQKITSEIKKNLDTPVVWGGIHAIISPEECIQYSDVVCLGEGEIPMWELAENIRGGKQATGIQSLWVKNNDSIERNELRPLIEDLDSLPFPDFIDEGNKFLIDSGRIVENPPIISAYEKNAYLIMSSRGCMFSCTYCCNSVIHEKYKGKGPYLRRRSVGNVIGELKLAIENKPIRFISFWDDIFTYDRHWIEEFCARYSAEISLPFYCYAHPKHTDKEILAKLTKSGLMYVTVGIQVGSESVARGIFGRDQNNRGILDFDREIRALNISRAYDLIVDNPYETEIDQDNTVELLLELSLGYRMAVYSLCYFPETPLTKKALKDGIIAHNDLEQYSSKALNNFNLFLPLAINKTQLFWGCLKAMAINKYFPRVLVRVCKKSSLFKNHPALLVFLCRLYLSILKPFNYNYAKKGKICLGASKFLFDKPKLTFYFFPLENTEISKRYCLKITNKTNKNLTMQFVYELWYGYSEKHKNMARWSKFKADLKANGQSSIYLDFKYPELYCSFDGITSKLKLLKDRKFDSKNGGSYLLRAKCRVLGKFLPKKFRHIGLIVCKI